MTRNLHTSYSDEHRYTTNHQAIRNWAEERDAIPVRVDEYADDESAGGDRGGGDRDGGERAGSEGAGSEDADREEATSSADYRFVSREERDDVDEEEAWNEFRDAFENDDHAFVYRDQRAENQQTAEPVEEDGTGQGDSNGLNHDDRPAVEDGEVQFHELVPADSVVDSNARRMDETDGPLTDR